MEDSKDPLGNLTAFVDFTAFELKIPMYFGNEFRQVQQAVRACATECQQQGRIQQASSTTLVEALQRLQAAIDVKDRVISQESCARQRM